MSFSVDGYIQENTNLAVHFIDVRQNQISKIPSVDHRITSEQYTEGLDQVLDGNLNFMKRLVRQNGTFASYP